MLQVLALATRNTTPPNRTWPVKSPRRRRRTNLRTAQKARGDWAEIPHRSSWPTPPRAPDLREVERSISPEIGETLTQNIGTARRIGSVRFGSILPPANGDRTDDPITNDLLGPHQYILRVE